jgi:hypothetical protein
VSVEVEWLCLRFFDVEDADRAVVVVFAGSEAAAVGEEGQGVGAALPARENDRLLSSAIRRSAFSRSWSNLSSSARRRCSSDRRRSSASPACRLASLASRNRIANEKSPP